MATTLFSVKRTYGAQTSIRFAVETSAGGALSIAAATIFDAGDFKISKDGGALANTTNLPTQITANQPLYEITLTATEMQASEIYVTGRDVATGSYQPVVITVTTRESYSQQTIDATNIGGNVTAVTLQGVGSGSGMLSILDVSILKLSVTSKNKLKQSKSELVNSSSCNILS